MSVASFASATGVFKRWCDTREHWHATADHILLYGVSALIFFNVWRIVAVQLGKQPGALGTIGTSMGALTHFGN